MEQKVKPVLINAKWTDKGTGESHQMNLTLSEFNRLVGWQQLGIIRILSPEYFAEGDEK